MIGQQPNLLIENNGVIRVPFLVKGKLVMPPEMSCTAIEAAFATVDADIDYIKLPNAQLLRERMIDRDTLRYTTAYRYQLMPAINSQSLLEQDFDQLVQGPYALKVAEILDYLTMIAEALTENRTLVERVRELCRQTTELPDLYLDAAFATFAYGFDGASAQVMIDQELAVWSKPGHEFLDGWVATPAQVLPSLVALLARDLPGQAQTTQQADEPTYIRAMPTRQLHITAGNAPSIPIVSALRLLLTKSVGVIKLPAGAILPGALLALMLASVAPDHPLTQHLSVVYWQGGDESVEQVLFMPNAFDRIVVWGAPGAVTAVQSKALLTKTVAFNPRYGISLIGQEAFNNHLETVVGQAALDTLINNQKACNAAQIHYVEGSLEQANTYAEQLRAVLGQWDMAAPQPVAPATRGQLKRMKRGKYANATWHLNTQVGEFQSGVVVMPDEFDILDHPMCRLVIVRCVDSLSAVFPYLHAGVSTAGVYPEARRLDLRDKIAARGVSSVLPLGQCERFYAGMPHDGMLVLNQLVEWKNA
ncbi:MAG: hypothetical protein NT075_17435 [Chloroflexi bacterium]|nr:hypothetical protein [Chloroflexota bacterium]